MQLFRVLGFGQGDDVADAVEHRASHIESVNQTPVYLSLFHHPCYL